MERYLIKSNIVSHMMKSTSCIQKQIMDTIAVICVHDFPHKWPNLLTELLDLLNSYDTRCFISALEAAHIIFKRYRYLKSAPILYEEINFVVSKFMRPLTEWMERTVRSNQFDENPANTVFESLCFMTKVYYSLTILHLPDIEGNFRIWMNSFYTVLDWDTDNVNII